jgi:hypothetical protein
VNVSIEGHIFLPEEKWTPEEIARISVAFSDTLVSLGYGNVAAENYEDTTLTSVLIVKPTKPNAWKSRAKDAMAVSFPTEDEAFIRQADAGGIIE